jgi:hypothetical protein
MTLLRVGSLPDDPLAASAAWHAEVLPQALRALDDGASVLTLVFAPADYAHRDWRRATVATLARERAPARINAIAADDEAAIAAAERYFAAAEAITGHYVSLDGAGAGSVL